MKKPLVLTCIFCILTFHDMRAQKSVPGYLGSRNLVGIKVMPNISFDEMFVNQLLLPSINLNYEWVQSRRGSVSFSAGQANNILYEEHYARFRGNENTLFVTVNNKLVKVKEYHGQLNYNNTYFSVSKSFYNLRSGSIAPQGKYFKMGLTINLMRIKKDQFEYTVEDNKSTKFTNPNETFKTLKLGSFNMEFGAKRFMGKHIFIQKALAVNMPFNFWTSSTSHAYYNLEDYNETNLIYAVSVAQTLNLSLALGYAF